MNWDRIAGATRQYWGKLTKDRRIRAEQAIARRAGEKQFAEWLERAHKADPIHK